MDKNPTRGIYLDLDCLYDTRLAVLEEIDPELAIAALEADYNTREEDIFPHLTKEAFRSVYNVRNITTLEKAMVSNCLLILKSFIDESQKEIGKTPFNTQTEVYLNVFPFNIDYQTAVSMVLPLQRMCGHTVKVEIVNWTAEKLTPAFIRSKIDLMLMYDYGPWLDAHASNGNFKKNQIPDKMLYVPKLYFNKKPNDEEMEELLRENKMTPFKSTEFLTSGIIGLEFIDVVNFNAALPINAVEEFKKRFQT